MDVFEELASIGIGSDSEPEVVSESMPEESKVSPLGLRLEELLVQAQKITEAIITISSIGAQLTDEISHIRNMMASAKNFADNGE